ncbi:MAG: hypothetical protein PWQ55_2526 [Chloroflexota bacterium]|nr:hypothetical protein [Chloroflexota bacterium]
MFNKWHIVLLAAIVVQYINSLLKSEYLFQFFDENLVLLLVALLAINNTTLGVIMTKLKEISQEYYTNFSNVISEMKISIKEQLILILVGALIQIFTKSTLPFSSNVNYLYISQVTLIFVFLYSLYILYDTADMIFVILQFENSESNSDEDT